MSKQCERDIEKYFVDEVEKVHGKTRKMQWVGRRSAPDRFVAFCNGWHGFVELKRPGGKPRPDQKREIETLRNMKVKVLVISTLGEVDDFIAGKALKW